MLPIVCLSNHFRNLLLDILFSYLLLYHFFAMNTSSERQLEQTVEEAAEFIQAAQKIKRYPGNSLQMNHLVEETGDLLITLEQIRIYLVRDGYGDALNSMIDYKLNRELGRMEQERKDNESKAYHNRRKRNPSKG